jgi:hypothetical protein
MRRRRGTRAIGFGTADLATGRAALRAGFFAVTTLREMGRLPLPDPLLWPLPAFFFAMARFRCLP